MDHLTLPAYSQGAFSLRHGLPLISTKLGPPRAAGTLLSRSRLLEKLDLLHERSLALVCGAAGFGKTTLLSQWRQCLLDQGHWGYPRLHPLVQRRGSNRRWRLREPDRR